MRRNGYGRGYYGRGCGSNDGLYGLIAIFLLAIFAMPLVGGYLLITGKDEGSKFLGGALLVVGIIVWIMMGMS